MPAEKSQFDAASENLRLVLPLMSTYRVPVEPRHYAVWYEYVAGTNNELKRAIDDMLAEQASIDVTVTQRLYQKFLETRERALVEQAQQKINDLLGTMNSSLNSAGEQVGRYQQSLDTSAALLNDSIDDGTLRDVVTDLVHNTAQMASSNSDLQQELECSRQEAEALRTELEAVRVESMSDPLTGLANRKGFEKRLAELRAADDYYENSHCLIIGDIDKFKSINDNYGHVFGDKILKVVAKVFANLTKGKDMAARFGGEEFVVLLPQTELNGARIVADSIRQQIERGRVFNPKTKEEIRRVTISFGVTEIIHDEPIEDTVARADKALYQAKANGRNRVEIALTDSFAEAG